ncbi:Hydroxydechloroatrazine ethylaminohydrolase [Pseudomonas syringae pv. maculicola]|uniref:Hydroxydechloroatrazine ethylaminohydrolase n=1 Tax=Pseudomonas syringae pv. maculicola TaxID=59511 RepID=A0A3M2VU34_PSEYM|nr:Hydroxydechloroatrazine ethylaminohydrolase [Pseudomonas syringae pv. maculicola]
MAVASKVALAELLLSGCTTAADHHYLFPDGLEHAIDVQVQSVRELGMRAMLTRGSMSLGEADGGLPPQQTVQQGEVILADSQRLIETYHERDDGAQIQIALAPCSPFSVTPQIMAESAALAEKLDVRLHTHLAETLDEEDFCLQRFGLRTRRCGHRRLSLPQLEHAPGLWHLPDPGPDCCRRAAWPRRGRLGVQ